MALIMHIRFGPNVTGLPPPGYAWLVDSQGNYIVDSNGNKIAVKVS